MGVPINKSHATGAFNDACTSRDKSQNNQLSQIDTFMRFAPGDKSVNLSRNVLDGSLNPLSQSLSPKEVGARKEKEQISTRQIVLKKNHLGMSKPLDL